jgi:Secretion system C-terminal sorting domain
LRAKVTQNGNITFLKGGLVTIGYELKQNSSCPTKKVYKDISIEERFNGQIFKDKDTLKINVTEGKTIKWFNCNQKDLILTNSTSKNYIPKKSGNYGVIVNSNVCRDTLSCFNVKMLLINELNPFKFNVYPNPVCSYLNIDLEEDFLNLNAEIIDITGKLVDSFVIYAHQKEYPIKLNKGHYNLKIISKESIFFVSSLLVE